MPLTAKRVEKLKSKPGRHRDQHGLYLQVISRTNISWVLRFQRNGRERWHGLGPLHTFGLAEARERARKARQQIFDGNDPIEAKAAARAAKALADAKLLTFEAAANQYFAQHEAKWRSARHRQQFINSLRRYAFPIIGKLPVAAIDVGLVLKTVEPIWPDIPETANRVRSRIEMILDWSKVRGYRTGDNPAKWELIGKVLPARSAVAKTMHHPALPYADAATFVAALRRRDGIAARALEFTILTAARTGETIGAVWDEIDLDAKMWTIPAGRIKGGREHRVPLSDRAVEILRALPTEKDNQHVFVGSQTGGGLSSAAFGATLRRMGRNDITVHGFRSTFSDWAHERSAFPNHVIELSLAHAVGNAVERAYRRGDLLDKRRQLMDAWARFIAMPPVVTGDNVIAVRS